MYWMTQVCFSSPAACPRGSFWGPEQEILGKSRPGQLGPSDPSPRHTVLGLASGFGSSGHRVPMRPSLQQSQPS